MTSLFVGDFLSISFNAIAYSICEKSKEYIVSGFYLIILEFIFNAVIFVFDTIVMVLFIRLLKYFILKIYDAKKEASVDGSFEFTRFNKFIIILTFILTIFHAYHSFCYLIFSAIVDYYMKKLDIDAGTPLN